MDDDKIDGDYKDLINISSEKRVRELTREEMHDSRNFRTIRNDNPDNVDLDGIVKIAKSASVLKDAFSSPIETAIVSQFSDNFMSKIFPSMSNDGPQPKESFLNSSFMMAVGSRLPDILPTLLDVGLSKIGKENTDTMINGLNNKFFNQKSEIQDTNEIILSMNPDDPADLQRFMGITGIDDPDFAKKNLLEHKQNIMEKIQQQEHQQQEYVQPQSQYVPHQQPQQQVMQQSQAEAVMANENEMMSQFIKIINDTKEENQKINQHNQSVFIEKLTEMDNHNVELQNKIVLIQKEINGILKSDSNGDEPFNTQLTEDITSDIENETVDTEIADVEIVEEIDKTSDNFVIKKKERVIDDESIEVGVTDEQ